MWNLIRLLPLMLGLNIPVGNEAGSILSIFFNLRNAYVPIH